MTEQAKPTPGPWFPIWNGHFWEITICNKKHAQSIATVHKNEYLPGDAEANARLIAAAWDLLAALKCLVGQEELGAMFSERIQKAMAAIAKAEGRS